MALTRRKFMQSMAAVAGTPMGFSVAPRYQRKNQKPPNILVILVDDLGLCDLGSFGSTTILTPAIDQLVQGGLKFTRAYANCPVCSPTRAALLTGCYPERVGVPGVIRTHDADSWGFLDPARVLLPEILRSVGYHTALIGKWHLGLEEPNRPNQRGFDLFRGFLGDMMDDYTTHRRHGQNYMYYNREEIDPQGHATELFTEWACDFLSTAGREKPFFLYLAYNAPHVPVQPPKEWLESFRQRVPQSDLKTAQLGAFIEHLDYQIGKVLQALEASGQAENTIVFFTSDNGGQVDVGANNGLNRAGKGTLYEGGLRVPLCVSWPGKIKPGGETDRIVLTMDLFPTILDLAGVEMEEDAFAFPIDGESFYRTLQGRTQRTSTRDLFFGRREGGDFFKGETIECIRRGDWKLLRSRPGGPFELYNLAQDPMEKNNLAAVEPAIVLELQAALEAQVAEYRKVRWKKPW
jgi:arylsulfatase A-like enzyme